MEPSLKHHQRYLIEEFAEAYQEHRLARRELLRRVLLLTGSVPLTASVLLALGCADSDEEPAAPPTATVPPVSTTEAGIGPGVAADDPTILAADVSFKGPASDIKGYLARPGASGRYPAVLVIPENRGLLDHFRDIARRFAKEGFVAVAFDPISRQGGTTPDMAALMAAYRSPTFTEDVTADMKATIDYLKSQSFVRANAIAVTGYCVGGTLAWEITLASADVKAVAPYYGSLCQDLYEPLGRTQAAVLAVYGAADTRTTAQVPMVEERLKASGKPYAIKIYEGAPHGFFNDTSPVTAGFGYHPQAAAQAWTDTLAWFRRHLAG